MLLAGCGDLQQASLTNETGASDPGPGVSSSTGLGGSGSISAPDSGPAVDGTTGSSDSAAPSTEDTDTGAGENSDSGGTAQSSTGGGEGSGDQATDTGDPVPDPATPATCQQLAAEQAGLADGEYTLYVGGMPGMPWTAYCVDLDGDPRAFLTLPAGLVNNYSQYSTGGPGTSVRTEFHRVAIDEVGLTIDVDDLTHASSSGGLFHGDFNVTTMPFGTAMNCGGAPGVARIDLTDTPFVVTSTFCVGGFRPSGNATASDGGRIIDITGSGGCGWTTPDANPCPLDPFNATANSVVQLAYVP